MKILLTNDDGIDSPGLLALAQALRDVAHLDIIAPDRNRSAIGHSITIHKPLIVDEDRLGDGTPAYSTDGTPSDCVRLAVLGIIESRPDLVISGINNGENLGDDITYSGTVSAALEGVINEIPSLAFSLVGSSPENFATAGAFARRLIIALQGRVLPGRTLLNVNVPDLPEGKIEGVEITRLGRRIYREKLVAKVEGGRTHYLVEGDTPRSHPEEGTDFNAIGRNRISITPLRIDMTDFSILDEARQWLGGLF